MLHMPHVVEEQFTIAHLAIREGTGIRKPGFCHARHHSVQPLAAALEVAEELVFSVGALRQDNRVIEFGESKWCWRAESGFVFFRKIEVEEEEYVKSQVPKRMPPLTVPHGIRAGFDRVGEHVDRGMELLPDRGSPKVNHEASRLAAKGLRKIDTASANKKSIGLSVEGTRISCKRQPPDCAGSVDHAVFMPPQSRAREHRPVQCV